MEGLELEDVVYIVFLMLKEMIEGEMNGEIIEIGGFCCCCYVVLRVFIDICDNRYCWIFSRLFFWC